MYSVRTEWSEYKCIKVEQNKIVSKSAEKLLKCRILFKDMLTFLGLNYRDASLITMYFFPKTEFKKSDQSDDFIT